jgi:hypothetical protein
MAMLRKRFIKGIPICGRHARHVAQLKCYWLAAECFGLLPDRFGSASVSAISLLTLVCKMSG